MTASRVRVALRHLVAAIGLVPAEFGFHVLPHTRACLAFDNSINLEQTKVHGSLKFNAIWTYLVKTAATAMEVDYTF